MKKTASETTPAAPPRVRRGADVDTKRTAAELYASGKSLDDIGSDLGVVGSTVGRWLRELDIPRRLNGNVAAAEREARRRYVTQLYGPERGSEVLGRLLGVSSATIRNDLRVLGNERHPPGRRSLHPQTDRRQCAREGCSQIFEPPAWLVARGGGTFCSESCRSLALFADPRKRARWYRARHKSTALYGTLGGRPRGYTDDHAQRVADLNARGLSERATARVLGLSKRQVHEILVAARSGPKP